MQCYISLFCLAINNVLVCGLVVGFFIFGCGQNQESPKYAGEDDSEIEKGRKIMQQSDADAAARAEAEIKAKVEAETETEYETRARVEAMKRRGPS